MKVMWSLRPVMHICQPAQIIASPAIGVHGAYIVCVCVYKLGLHINVAHGRARGRHPELNTIYCAFTKRCHALGAALHVQVDSNVGAQRLVLSRLDRCHWLRISKTSNRYTCTVWQRHYWKSMDIQNNRWRTQIDNHLSEGLHFATEPVTSLVLRVLRYHTDGTHQ